MSAWTIAKGVALGSMLPGLIVIGLMFAAAVVIALCLLVSAAIGGVRKWWRL